MGNFIRKDRKKPSALTAPKTKSKVGPLLFEISKESDRLLNTGELAALLAVSVNTVRKWRHQERIPYVKVGTGTIRYHLKTVLSWLQPGGRTANGND